MGTKTLLGGVAAALLLHTLAPCRADEPPLPVPGSRPKPVTVAAKQPREVGTLVKPGGTYSVVSGDTLSEIATRHGVSLESLIAANPQIRDPNRIWPGDRVTIPTGGSTPRPTTSTGTASQPSSYQGPTYQGSTPSTPTTPTPTTTSSSLGTGSAPTTTTTPVAGGDSAPTDAAHSLVGTANPNAGSGGSWAGWCLGMVNQAFKKAGRVLPQLQVSCAKEAYDMFKREGLIQTGPNPPRGAILFWSWVGTLDGVTKDWGHVAIANGDGTCISTMMTGEIDPAVPISRFGPLLGWVLPPAPAGK